MRRNEILPVARRCGGCGSDLAAVSEIDHRVGKCVERVGHPDAFEAQQEQARIRDDPGATGGDVRCRSHVRYANRASTSDENLISTRRGRFIITDEAALRTRSCSCTTSIEDHSDSVLYGIYPPG
jgi:hypothetical protein